MDHIVKEIESRDPVQPGDDQAESELAGKFLDLYELTSYYQVDEAFLSLKVLANILKRDPNLRPFNLLYLLRKIPRENHLQRGGRKDLQWSP